MKPLDYFILALVALWFIAALRSIWKKRGGCSCSPCSAGKSSSGCDGCRACPGKGSGGAASCRACSGKGSGGTCKEIEKQ